MPKTPKHWNYFLAVELELLGTARFVEFAPANYGCFSNEFAKLIVLASSEVDSIFSELCRHIAPQESAGKITDYYPILLNKYPRLIDCQLSIDRYQITLQPWQQWTEINRPDWWSKSYNKLKHERSEHLERATLEAALNAVGAQFLALQLFHHAVHGEHVSVDLSLRSTLFAPKAKGEFRGGAYWSYGDPFDHLLSD